VDFKKYDGSMELRDKEGKAAAALAHGFGFISELVYTWFFWEGRSPDEIAQVFGVSFQTIYRWLQVWDFEPPDDSIRTGLTPAASFTGESEYAPITPGAARALWRGVLRQAIADLEATAGPWDRDAVQKRRKAVRWFNDKKDLVCPSFIWVAEFLKLDPGAVRKAVLK
jgi:hypothetical protein